MQKKVEISKVDENFKINNQDNKNLKWINPKNSNLVKVYGLNWFYKDFRYHRFPKETDETIKNLSGSLDVLTANTSGGSIAFYSNTKTLKIKVKLSYMFHMGHMPYTGQAGFDLYLGKSFNELKFYRSSNFDFNNYEYEFTFFENAEINDINLHMLNFPLYASVDEVLIGIDEDATIYSEENLFPNSGKIVFYGTSITQGGCASLPGSSYTQVVARHLGYECLNFGFSGNGKGQIEVAEILSKIENVKMFVLNYEANVYFDQLKQTVWNFIAKLRETYPTVPIILMSKIRFFDENHFVSVKKTEHMIRTYQRNVVKKLSQTDNNIYYYDGSKLLGSDFEEKTVDGVHPNDYGFYSIAKVVEKFIAKKL